MNFETPDTNSEKISALVQRYTEEAARTRARAKESFFLLWMEAYLKRTGADAEELVLVEEHDQANGKVRYWLEPKSVNEKRDGQPTTSS